MPPELADSVLVAHAPRPLTPCQPSRLSCWVQAPLAASGVRGVPVAQKDAAHFILIFC